MAEAMVLFLFHQLEPLGLVDLPRRVEYVVGPKHHLAVGRSLCEANAFLYQTTADAEAARRGLDVEQTQLGDGFRFGDAEDCPHDLSIPLGHPAALPLRILILDEPGADLGYECLEALVPTVLLIVDNSLSVDDPAHVAGLVRAQDIGRGGRGSQTKQSL